MLNYIVKGLVISFAGYMLFLAVENYGVIPLIIGIPIMGWLTEKIGRWGEE